MNHCTIRGEAIPKVGLGTSRLSGSECVTTVERALDRGYRFVDTARRYGNHAEVGEALERSPVDRDEVFLTTKIQRQNLRYNDVLAATEDCLAELGVEYIDLLLIHWPSRLVPIDETLAAMNRLEAAGTVRHVGVSNFTPEGFAAACEHGDLLANEVLYNPYKDQEPIREVCAENDALLVAYSPLAKGFVPRNPVVREIAWRHQRSPAQIALRWLVQQDNVVAIPKSTKPEHLRENLEVFDFQLADHEMERIANVEGQPLVRLLHRLPSLVRSTPADTRGCQRKIVTVD